MYVLAQFVVVNDGVFFRRINLVIVWEYMMTNEDVSGLQLAAVSDDRAMCVKPSALRGEVEHLTRIRY